MKKLNQTEVLALANKILSGYNDKSSQDFLNTEEKVLKDFDEIWGEFLLSEDAKVLEKYGISLNNAAKKIFQDVQINGLLFSLVYKPHLNKISGHSRSYGSVYVYDIRGSVKPPSLQNIRDEITLSQIEDMESIDNLISAVKEKLGI